MYINQGEIQLATFAPTMLKGVCLVKQTKKSVDRVCDESNQEGFERKEVLQRNHYFDNELVEHLLCLYHETACTNVKLRDMIMVHADELIRQTIKAHNLSQIYPGKEESSIGDLFQTAWVQIESALYKYDARPHCNKCYNPLRPGDSVLTDEFMMADDILKKIRTCPKCKTTLTREFIHYRGKSKVFNMWCVRPDTKIFTQEGIMEIGKCLPDHHSGQIEYGDINNLKVFGLGGLNNTTAYIRRPMSKTLSIVTSQGYNIEVTPEHEVLVLNERKTEWVKAMDLVPGMLLAIQYQQRCFGSNNQITYKPDNNFDGWLPPKNWTPALAYLIGLTISEGCITNRGLTICNMEKEVVDFTQSSPYNLHFRKEGQVKLICSSTRLVDFLKWLGIGPGCIADKKNIPYNLFGCSEIILKWLLRGMFDGDGHSSRHNGCVGYTSTSKILIDQLRILLLNFGIITKTSIDNRTESKFTVKGKTYISKKKPAYQLLLSTIDSRKFYEIIGFNVARKQEKMRMLNSERYFMPPIIMEQVRNLIITSDISRTHIDKITRSSNRKNGLQIHNMIKHASITRDVLETLLCTYQQESDHYSYLSDRLNESYNTKWLPIVSITGSKSPTVDITVPATRSFTANGIIVSNSQISRTVILAYIKKESRDRKNSPIFTTHLENKTVAKSHVLNRFTIEAREICKYNPEYIKIIDTIEKLYDQDERPHEGLVAKLSEKTGLKRIIISDFLRLLRQRSFEFTDSPVNEEFETIKHRMNSSDKEKEDE